MNLQNRYEDIATKLNENRKRVYSTILYPKIIPRNSDIYIIPNDEDRLDLLAYRYYGDTKYWWIIAQANALGKGGFHIRRNIRRLRIPMDLPKILEAFEAINNTR